MTTQDVSVSNAEPYVSDAELAEIDSFDSALALVNEKLGGEVVEADKDLGTGFALLDGKDKDKLCGVTFLAIKIEQHAGDHGMFTTMHVVTADGRKFIVNDGSTGIHEQIQTLWTRKPEKVGAPLLVRKGLRRSDYTHPEYGPSTTYYLDTSAS